VPKSSDANLTYHQHDVHGNRSLDRAGASAGGGGERGADAYGAVQYKTDAMIETLRARGQKNMRCLHPKSNCFFRLNHFIFEKYPHLPP